MASIFFTLVLIWFVFMRVMYIHGMLSDFNYKLDIYIEEVGKMNIPNKEGYLDWLEKQYLKSWKYYHRLDLWTIDHIVNDPLLIYDVNYHFARRNSKS